jgi:hypothetical protein
MVDTQDLGSCAERRVGSSPTFRTDRSPDSETPPARIRDTPGVSRYIKR